MRGIDFLAYDFISVESRVLKSRGGVWRGVAIYTRGRDFIDRVRDYCFSFSQEFSYDRGCVCVAMRYDEFLRFLNFDFPDDCLL